MIEVPEKRWTFSSHKEVLKNKDATRRGKTRPRLISAPVPSGGRTSWKVKSAAQPQEKKKKRKQAL